MIGGLLHGTKYSFQWTKLVLLVLAISIAVGLIFGFVGSIFDISIPGSIIGAAGGVIFGLVLLFRLKNLKV